jgi:TM2 domain-containing membrane protein YozV
MLYCFNCGTSLDENAVTCPNCGQRQNNIPVSSHNEVSPEQLQAPAQSQPTYLGAPGTNPGGYQGQFQGPNPNQPFSQSQPQGPYEGASVGQQPYTGPANGPYQGVQPGWPQYGQPPYSAEVPYPGPQPYPRQVPYPAQSQPLPVQSPKSKTATLILCWFLGCLGGHRFYAGRIVTGIIMLLTLGGLGIWTLIDFINAAGGKLRDGEGKLINKPANVGLVVGLIIGLSIVGILMIPMIFAAIVIPQYHQYMVKEQERAVLATLESIKLAEQLYFVDYNTYTDSYEELTKYSLIKNNFINYGPISVINNGYNYTVSVKHKLSKSSIFTYDSSSTDIYSVDKSNINEKITYSAW